MSCPNCGYCPHCGRSNPKDNKPLCYTCFTNHHGWEICPALGYTIYASPTSGGLY